MGNIVKKTLCENPKKKEKLLKTADNSNRKAPALSRGNIFRLSSVASDASVL